VKIYACYTRSHERMLCEHFLPSLGFDWGTVRKANEKAPSPKVNLCELPQDCPTGEFNTAGFQATCLGKVDFILEALKTETEPFIFSDVDVRFYGTVVADLLKCLGDADMAFQWDGPRGRECSGFMALRPSPKLLRFWQGARDLMRERGYMDQDALHHRLAVDTVKRESDGGNITWVVLPERYWTFGRDDKHWTPGMQVNPPADLLMHHANWTTGVENKLRLLEEVRLEHGRREAAIKGGFLGYCTPNAEPAQEVEPQATVERTLPYSEVTRLLDDQRRQFAKTWHHPMPLALVLQFWQGDRRRALELARLLADIEPEPREDALLVFARQSNCAIDRELREGMNYAGQKFDVMDLETYVDEKKRYPGICFDPWASAAQQLSDMYYRGRIPHHSAFFFEADGCPLRGTWIDDLKAAHAETLLLGKRITGPHMRYGGHDHINGSLVMHLSCWEDHPSLRRCPPAVAWDVHHGPVLVNEAGPSQVIRNEHGMQGVTENQWWILAKESAWLTSVKDGTPQHWARRALVKS
jgi:hypothetical protein